VLILGIINAALILYRIEWGLYCFTALIPLSVLLPITPIPGINGTTILIILLFIKSYSHQKPQVTNKYNPPNLGLPIVCLFVVTIFSIISSTTLYDYQSYPLIDYFIKLKRWFIFVFLYFIYAREITTKKRIYYTLLALTAGLFIEGSYVLKAMILAGRLRTYGTIGNANELAQFFSSYFLIPLVLLLYKKKISYKLFCISTLILALNGIVSTLSRGGFLCAIIAIIIYIFAKSKRLAVLLTALVVVFSGTLYSLLPEKMLSRIEETFVEKHNGYQNIGGVTVESSAYSRIPLLKGGLIMFKENPIFGKGFMAFPQLIPGFKYGGQFGVDHRKASHNMHIRILSEMGIAGYIFFIFIFINSVRMGYLLYEKTSDRFSKDIGIVLICSTATFLIGCLFGDRFFRGILITYFFVIASCCYNLYCLEFSETDESMKKQ